MLSDDRWWDITTYYLIFLTLNLGLSYLLFRAWRDHIKTWKEQLSRWRIALLLLAACLIVFSTAVLLLLLFATYESWQTALNPDTPAPMYELFWIFGIFAVCVPAAFAGMLHSFIRKEYDDLMP